MVANLSSEKELSRIIDEYKEKYSDYGRDRRSALDWHVTQIKRLLLPTTTTQFSLWILDQPDEFYDVDIEKVCIMLRVRLLRFWDVIWDKHKFSPAVI